MVDENTNSLALFAEDRFEPCRVCGEPSSGWHCGAVTCEACKVSLLHSLLRRAFFINQWTESRNIFIIKILLRNFS